MFDRNITHGNIWAKAVMLDAANTPMLTDIEGSSRASSEVNSQSMINWWLFTNLKKCETIVAMFVHLIIIASFPYLQYREIMRWQAVEVLNQTSKTTPSTDVYVCICLSSLQAMFTSLKSIFKLVIWRSHVGDCIKR